MTISNRFLYTLIVADVVMLVATFVIGSVIHKGLALAAPFKRMFGRSKPASSSTDR